MRVLRALTLLAALLLTSCGCLDFSKGEMTVQTDCSTQGKGDFSSSSFTFQKLPEAAAKSLLSYFGINQASQSQIDSVSKLLDCPSGGDLSCDARGAGLDKSGAVANVVTPGAALCGSKLISVGKVTDDSGNTVGFYVCNAPDSAVSDQLWIMQCQRFALSASEQLGTCHGLATYKVQTGL